MSSRLSLFLHSRVQSFRYAFAGLVVRAAHAAQRLDPRRCQPAGGPRLRLAAT